MDIISFFSPDFCGVGNSGMDVIALTTYFAKNAFHAPEIYILRVKQSSEKKNWSTRYKQMP